jgi:hypothetical protein
MNLLCLRRADLEITMRPMLTRSAAIAPLVVLGLLLGACSGGGDDTTDEPTTATTEDTAEDDKGKGDEPAEDTTEGDDDAQGASEGAGCLEGDWAADVDEQLAALEAATAASGVEATIDITGDVVTSFSGGTTTSVYNNQVMNMGIAMEGQEISTITTMNGTLLGTYTATDTEVTMTVTDASGLDIQMQTSMGGTVIDDGTALGDQMRDAMEVTSTTAYTCSGDTLTISVPNAGLGTSIDTVMHRR